MGKTNPPKAVDGNLSTAAARPVGTPEMIEAELDNRKALKFIECNGEEMLQQTQAQGLLLRALGKQTEDLRKFATDTMPEITPDIAQRLKEEWEAEAADKDDEGDSDNKVISLEALLDRVTEIHETVTHTTQAQRNANPSFLEQLEAMRADAEAAVAEEAMAAEDEDG